VGRKALEEPEPGEEHRHADERDERIAGHEPRAVEEHLPQALRDQPRGLSATIRRIDSGTSVAG
jgi:hypothetical protein